MGTASSPLERSEEEARAQPRVAGRLPRPRGRSGVLYLVLLASLPLLIYLLAPILGLMARITPRSYSCCWEAASALRLSLFTATLSLAISILIGTPVAYWLSHYQFRGKDVIDTLIDLPLVLPPVAAAWLCCCSTGSRALGRCSPLMTCASPSPGPRW